VLHTIIISLVLDKFNCEQLILYAMKQVKEDSELD